MGYWKKLVVFCQIHELDPNLKSSKDFYAVSEKLGLSAEQEAVMVGSGRLYSLCPYCGKKRSKRFLHADWHCFYCGKTEEVAREPDSDVDDELAIDMLVMDQIERELEKSKRTRNRDLALRLWGESVSIIGTAGERYLAARRLEPPPDPDSVLRWHPSCKFGRELRPCMIALFRDALTDEPTAIHRTCIISRDQAERMALGANSEVRDQAVAAGQ